MVVLAENFKSKNLHFQEIKKLQETLRKKNQSFSLKNNVPSNTLRTGKYKTESVQLDLSSFDGILEINPFEKWILVEPRVTFECLCEFTLKYGLIPPVVPEFTSITVGGAIMGAALESSSHRFGQVSDTCLEYECLLGNGEIVTATAKENADLFYGCSGSYGTLAILTAIKLRLIESKKWVRLTYHSFHAIKEAIQLLTSPCDEDFIEGIVYSPKHAVVITAKMVEEKGSPLFRQKHFWSPWYVQRVFSSKANTDTMDIKEYLFRHDRGAFWIGRYVHSPVTMLRLIFHLGIPQIDKHDFNPNLFFRLAFGWAFSSQRLYKLWHRVPGSISEKLFFIHDFYSPFSQAETTFHSFMEKTHIFPIWLCPVKGTKTPQFLSPHFGETNFLNIGLYGIPPQATTIPELSAALEKKIVSFGGRKMLYSFTYYDQETFAKIYSENLYSGLRKKFFAEKVFPSLYNKVTNNWTM